ncbi:hypothetical protein [Cognatiyoonia sp.]
MNRYLHLMSDMNLPAGTARFELVHTAEGLWIVDHMVTPMA